ncbi:MAG: hypothetical protein K2X82_31025 [Gemmataceae bacterium]|nr:hypothetical protein [Gemmataceae bacterium]
MTVTVTVSGIGQPKPEIEQEKRVVEENRGDRYRVMDQDGVIGRAQ